jgi:hypothetical protein
MEIEEVHREEIFFLHSILMPELLVLIGNWLLKSLVKIQIGEISN